jgi:hypothetical protein
MTVSIGFDHAENFGIRADFGLHLAQVPAQRVEVNETKGGPAVGHI